MSLDMAGFGVGVRLFVDCLFTNCLFDPRVPVVLRFGVTGATWTVNENT